MQYARTTTEHRAITATGTTPDANLVDDHGHSHDMSWVFARVLIPLGSDGSRPLPRRM